MICLKNVSYTYPNGVKALKDINLKIEENTFIGGLTGSGKSTLLRVFNGLIPNFYCGKLDGIVKIAEKPYLVFQNAVEQIIFNTVFDELAIHAYQVGRDLSDVKKIAKRLEIEHILSRDVHKLSDGEKRLVTIACALLSGEVVALDEPFANLHPSIAKEILNLLLKNAKLIILSEHKLEFKKGFEVVWLENGRISSFKRQELNIGFNAKCSDDTVLKVENLCFGYDRFLLKDVTFEVNRGEICAIIGKNGCGKTTLLKLIAGILKPWSGKIDVKGKIGLCLSTPNYHLFADNVVEEIGTEMVKVFELERFANRHPHSLSFGQARRVAIAKAFRGDIVLLDEPTAGQDYLFKYKLLEVTRKLGKTVVMATHDYELLEWCDVVVEL
jgi:energy-coupling factor transport system ATP-binding protein